MKKLLLLAAAMGASGFASAQEQGRVISSTPVVQQVAVPRQVCTNEAVAVQAPTSGAGAVMGALAGGALGNAAGGGQGKAALTVLGVIGGAVLGNKVEGNGGTQVQNAQRCTTQTFYESRATAYNVVYEFNGQQYSVQLPSDPGPTVQLQVTPVNAQPANNLSPGGTISGPISQVNGVMPAVAYAAPAVVYTAPAYYQPYYYPSVSLGLGYYGGYYGGYHGGRHHWR